VSGDTVYDPCNPLLSTTLLEGISLIDMRRVVMADGHRTAKAEPLELMADRSINELARLPQGCLRFINPHRYKVSISSRLNQLRNQLISEAQDKGA